MNCDQSCIEAVMQDLIQSLGSGDALILAAPPGYGKTYKTLQAIKALKRKTLFIFPLRALCDEVYLSAQQMGLRVLNFKSKKESINSELNSQFLLYLTTPECLHSDFMEWLEEETLIIFDECHLIYYWGESFRYQLIETFENICAYSNPTLFLSATINDLLLKKYKRDLSLNYQNTYFINLGNQILKNRPRIVYYYFFSLKNWLRDDYFLQKQDGVNLIFCKYRSEVKQIEQRLLASNKKVLSCVGGEAAEFTQKLNSGVEFQYIVATSVISHGVNLPKIKNIYFTHKVENIDFYIQMLGRGGRSGEDFNVHTFNNDYFKRRELILGVFRVFMKRIRNKIKSFVYLSNEC